MNASAIDRCFHCGEPIAPTTHIYAQIKQQQVAMCCEGCRAVAELIAGVGLDDYYRYRSEPALKPEAADCNDAWLAYEQPEIVSQYVRDEADHRQSVVLVVDGLRCAACGWLIERMLRRLPGVTQVGVNAATARVSVMWQQDECSLAAVLRSVSSLGYRPHPLDAEHLQQHAQDERRNALKRLGVAGLGMMQVMMYVLPLYARLQTHMEDTVVNYLQLIGLLLTTPVLFYAGWPFLSNAARALQHRTISMDVPVALALLLAYAASVYNTLMRHGEVYFDSITMFIFFLTAGRFIEMTLRQRSGSITDALARLRPRVAHRITVDAAGQEQQQDIPSSALNIRDEVWVRVGEAVPADGTVIKGASSVDESLLTGESLPVARQVGDPVLAGTINVEAPLRARVTAIGSATVLSSVIALLERAQADKSRMALLADRIARHFLNGLLVFTVLVGVAWYVIDPTRAFDAVLAVLVVTCPCALSLATPAVIAAATTALARRGLIVTNADAIERLASVKHMVFDKTGTLTTGRIAIGGVQCVSTLSQERCLSIAAALEQAADHPIARAFRDATAQYVSLNTIDLQVVPGAGVAGSIEGIRYRLGTPAFVAALRGSKAEHAEAAVIVLGDERMELARIELCDAVRFEAPSAVKQLAALNVNTSILSGDALTAVQRVAQACGIGEYQARQTPADKLIALQALKQRDEVVAMVGDGINDAPVLSAADVSIAMGGGTALAQASAAVILTSNNLQALAHAVQLSRRARRIMRQNLVWAAFYNLAAIPLAAMNMIPPWLAALGMSVSSVLVVLNAARILREVPNVSEASGTTANSAEVTIPSHSIITPPQASLV